MKDNVLPVSQRGGFHSEFRVCVLSTSQDARPERDVLNREVFPHLRSRLSERGISLAVNDPRWEAMLAPQQVEQIVKEGLEELYSYRPVVIGILGRGRGSAGSLPWLQDMAGDPGIAIRYMTRVLDSGMMRDRALFYILKGGPSSLESSGSDTEGSEAVARLIERVRSEGFTVREGIADADELARHIAVDLMGVVERGDVKGRGGPAVDRDRRTQAQFADTHRRGYVEIGSYLDRLSDQVLGEGRSVLVTGQSGAGKSALLVNWMDLVRTSHPEVVLFSRFVDAAAGDHSLVSVLRYLMKDLKRYCDIEEPIADDIAALLEQFPLWLAHVPVDRVMVMIIDGIDPLAAGPHGLRWLPSRLPGNVRLVASGIRVRPLPSPVWTELRIEPLTLAQTRSIADRLVIESTSIRSSELFHRVVHAAVQPSPLFLRTVARYAESAARSADPAAFSGIATVEELMERILQQCEGLFGVSLVGRMLALLRYARKGLSREELLLLTAADPGILSALLRELGHYLVDRDGLLCYIHDHVRHAVERRYVQSVDAAVRLHGDLARSFAGCPDIERRADEEPWHLQHAGDREGLADCITQIPIFMVLSSEERRYELLGYCLAVDNPDALVRRYETRLAEWEERMQGTGESVKVMEQLGRFCTVAGWLPHAERFLRAALHSRRALGSATEAGIADTLHDLAELLRHAGRFAEAEELYLEVVEIRERSATPMDPALAGALSDLALLYREQRRPDRALPLYLRAMELKERVHGTHHPATAESLNDLALLYHDLGDLEAAVALNRRALEIRQRRFGLSHPVVATSHNNLGSLYWDMEDPVSAECEYRLALAIGEERLGPDHPHTIGTVANLASLLLSCSRFEEAGHLLKRALDTTAQTLGAHHPNAIAFSINYAMLLRNKGDMAGAEKVLRDTLNILLPMPDHPHVPTCANNLAAVLRMTGRPEEALPLYRIALERWEQSIGENHLNVASVLQNMASLYFRDGEHELAEPLVRRALILHKQHLGAEHPFTQQSEQLLAGILQRAEN